MNTLRKAPIALAIIVLVLLAGCSTPRDPWQKWQSENETEEWNFDSATGKWEKTP